jgi:hypothetical protein
MTYTEVKEEIGRMNEQERQRLLSHLVSLRVKENESYRRELGRRLADKDPENWIPLDEAERRLKKD